MAGVTVTFTAPASGASGAFGASATATATTNGSGVATAPTLTANGTAGSYTVTASAPGVATPADFQPDQHGHGRSDPLSGSVTTASAAVNLATEGATDWIDWGTGGVNRKAGGGTQLSTFTVVGSGAVAHLHRRSAAGELDGRDADGQPHERSERVVHLRDRERLYVHGTGRHHAADADCACGRVAKRGTLTAHLSDGSAADYGNTTGTILNVQYDRNYTLTYRASGPGQTLRVTWTMVSTGGSDGNVNISAAALSVGP